jgi:hypothetical protein
MLFLKGNEPYFITLPVEMKNLYFIAVIPHKDLQEKVRLLKLQMKK